VVSRHLGRLLTNSGRGLMTDFVNQSDPVLWQSHFSSFIEEFPGMLIYLFQKMGSETGSFSICHLPFLIFHLVRVGLCDFVDRSSSLNQKRSTKPHEPTRNRICE
jgi:hypothetical protein